MSAIGRSMDAVGAAAASRVARHRRSQPNGWWGMALLVATEATLVGCVIATYYYLRFNAPRWPPPGIEKPDVTTPLVLLGVFLTSAAPTFLAGRAARRGRTVACWWLLALALLIQAGYFGYELHAFSDDLHKFAPSDNAYGSIYFTMLALDHAHIAVGILLTLGVLAKLLGGLTNYRLIGVRALVLYWHFVVALTACIVLTQLSPSL
jgi:heme/copper-type cytochrome/quinol oxidase subunit 3